MSISRILPLTEPDVISYAHHSYFLSVMYNDPDCVKWVYSNYVQLYMSPSGTFIDYYTPNPEYYSIHALFGSERITRDTVMQFFPKVYEFIRKQIDNGFYCYTFVNDYYVPGTFSYENQSYSHAILVHGYDDSRQLFHISTYYAKQMYGQGTISYESFEKAFVDNAVNTRFAPQEFVVLFKIHQQFKTRYDFKLHWVMEQLDEFLHSKPSSDRLKALETREEVPARIFGLKVYEELQRKIRIDLQSDNRCMLDHRPYYVIWEHKKLMNRRLDYMSEHGYFRFSDSVFKGYKDAEAIALMIRNLKFKYLLTWEDKHMEQIDSRLDQLKALEQDLVTRMLDEYGFANDNSLPQIKEEIG